MRMLSEEKYNEFKDAANEMKESDFIADKAWGSGVLSVLEQLKNFK